MAVSTGRRSGCSHVRSPAKSLAMKLPMGFARAQITTVKTRICRIPFAVMTVPLKALWAKQCVKQVAGERDRHYQSDSIFQRHNFSHPFTNAQLIAKNRI